MEDGFGIANSSETVTQPTQLVAKFGVVIDFAVESKDGIAIRAFEWLVSTREVDDAQTNGPDGDRLGLVEPLLIGSAMSKCKSRSTNESAFTPTLEVCIPGYPAQIPVTLSGLGFSPVPPTFWPRMAD